MSEQEKTNLLLSCLSVQLDIMIQVSILHDVKSAKVKDIESQRIQAIDNVTEVLKDE